MELQALQKVLDLQKKAYALLLWIDQRAATQPQWLDDEHLATYRSGTECESWLTKVWDSLPQDCRPERADLRRFAFLLASFFQTSFQVAETGRGWDKYENDWSLPARRRLVSRANQPGTAKPRKFRKLHRAKEAETVCNLQLLALEGLAVELGLPLVREELERVQSHAELQAALNLWSYAWELVRRSEFGSQGAAVHQMWLGISLKDRSHLDASTVWRARERLATALKHHAQ